MRVKEEVKKQIDQVQEADDFEYLQKITASNHRSAKRKKQRLNMHLFTVWLIFARTVACEVFLLSQSNT